MVDRGVDQGLDSRRRGQGGGWWGLGGGSKGFGSGGTGPRDGANFATCVVFLSFLTRTKRKKDGVF